MWKQLSSLDNRFKDYYFINENGEVLSKKGKGKVLTPTNMNYVLMGLDGKRYSLTVERVKKVFKGICFVEDLEGELWDWIKGYEGKYSVSTKGRVKSFTSKMNGELMVQTPNNKGYLEIKLFMNGMCKKYKVHRLVGETFIPNPFDLETINHKDFNKKNNSIENLEWMSLSDNIRHSFQNKRESK